MKHSHSMYFVLSLLVLLSGAAGLLYEVIWTRVLVHALGSTAQAVASVLAAFLGGLAVGAATLGRRANRARNPLLFYAALETLDQGVGNVVITSGLAEAPITSAMEGKGGTIIVR